MNSFLSYFYFDIIFFILNFDQIKSEIFLGKDNSFRLLQNNFKSSTFVKEFGILEENQITSANILEFNNNSFLVLGSTLNSILITN